MPLAALMMIVLTTMFASVASVLQMAAVELLPRLLPLPALGRVTALAPHVALTTIALMTTFARVANAPRTDESEGILISSNCVCAMKPF